MPAPTTPDDSITLLSQVNGNPYDPVTNPRGLPQGGHKVNWVPSMNALATIANWIVAVVTYLTSLAAQVATDAASAAAGSGTEATVSSIRAGLAAFYLSIRNVYAANAPVALTDAASIAWDMSRGINFSITLGSQGRALANPTNQIAGKSGLLIVTQDAAGGRSITSFGNNLIWIGGQPAWPLTPNAKTVISYFVEANGTVLLTAGGSSV